MFRIIIISLLVICHSECFASRLVSLIEQKQLQFQTMEAVRSCTTTLSPNLDARLTPSKWLTRKAENFTKENLTLLLENKIPSIKIPKFLNQPECLRMITAAQSIGFDFYEGVTPPIGKIGITQFEHSEKDKQLYFNQVTIANSKREELYSQAAFNTLIEIQKLFSENIGQSIEVAKEDDGKTYFAGLVRHINSAHLHFDYAPFDAKGWHIQRIEEQLAWNVYLETAQEGGELVVYNIPWEADIYEKFLLPGHTGSYGFDKTIVKDIESFVIRPSRGDLYIFNSRNFHEVLPARGLRITNSSFIGRYPNGKFVMWS